MKPAHKIKDDPKVLVIERVFNAPRERAEVTAQWEAYHATDIERETFEEGASSMQQGWTGSFEQLDAFLGHVSSDKVQHEIHGRMSLRQRAVRGRNDHRQDHVMQLLRLLEKRAPAGVYARKAFQVAKRRGFANGLPVWKKDHPPPFLQSLRHRLFRQRNDARRDKNGGRQRALSG